MTSFSNRLYELRKQRELTQSELADYVGLNKQTISQYERGVRRPDLDTLSALCDFFNVSTDYMLGKADITLRYVDSDGLARLDGSAASSSDFFLSQDEASLIEDYKKLNNAGKTKVREYANDLTEQERYNKDTGSSGNIAM